MNANFEKVIAEVTIRLKIGESVVGTGIIINLGSENYGLLCLKHCLFQKGNNNEQIGDTIEFEFWDNSSGDFVKSEAKVEIGTGLQYLNEDEDEILLFKIPRSQISKNLDLNFELCIIPHGNISTYWTYGYPNGNGNKPTSVGLTHNTTTTDHFILGVNTREIESNESYLDENTKGFSGSGIWFEFNHKFYLLGLFKGAKSDIPLIKAKKLTNTLFDGLDTDLIDFSKPINELAEKNEKSTRSTAALLSFKSEYVDFKGRDKELADLQNFVEKDKEVSWIRLSGNGGSGKHRLLLELSKILHNQGWAIKNIESLKEVNQFIEAPLSHDTLIIVDYERIYSELLSKEGNLGLRYFFSVLKPSLALESIYSLKIVIVARNFESSFQESVAADLLISQQQHNPIVLGKLTDPEYLSIVKDIEAKQHKKITISDENVLRRSKSIDKTRAPLFAQIFALALVEGVSMENWAEDSLLEYIYAREKLKLRERYSDIEKHFNLVGVLFTLNEPSMKFARSLMQTGFSFLPTSGNINLDFVESFFENRVDSLISKFPDLIRVFFADKILSDVKKESLKFDGSTEINSLFSFIIDFKENEQTINTDGFTSLKKIDLEIDERHNLVTFLIHLLQSFPESDMSQSLAMFYQSKLTIKGISYPSVVLSIIVDMVEGYARSNPKKMISYSKIIDLLDPHFSSYTDKINTCKFYTYNIGEGLNIGESYLKIKAISDYFFVNPNVSLLPMTDEESERLFSIAKVGGNPFDHVLPRTFVKWEGVQLWEANALLLILKSGQNEELTKRFEYLVENCTDPRIFDRYVDFVRSDQFQYSQVEKIEKLKFVLNKIIATGEQMSEINTEREVITSCLKVFSFLIANGVEPVFLHYLKSLKSRIDSISNEEKKAYFMNGFKYEVDTLSQNLNLAIKHLIYLILKN